MPGAVGAGSFWKGMVDYSGGKSAKQVADEIQKSWDTFEVIPFLNHPWRCCFASASYLHRLRLRA